MMDPEVDLGSVDTDSVLTLMECPVCLDHITPPVKQCVKVCGLVIWRLESLQ